MTQEENLFVVAMEACGELSQELSRTLRFGPYNHAPENEVTNIDRVRIEYERLKAVISQIDESYDKNVTDKELKNIYRDKIIATEQWAEVSKVEGCIQ